MYIKDIDAARNCGAFECKRDEMLTSLNKFTMDEVYLLLFRSRPYV